MSANLTAMKNDPRRLVDEPAYTAAEVARLLGLPAATVRAWFFGMSNATAREFCKVLDPADPERRLLSFANLCEAHVLAILRRAHSIPMPVVRKGLLYLAKREDVARPLLSRRFLTDPTRGLFVEDDGKLLDLSRDGQLAIREVLEAALARIEWADRDTPVRLFPVPPYAGDPGEAARDVAIDPKIGFGRPLLAKAGVPTAVISERFRAGDTISDLAADFEVEPAMIEEALRFEQRLASPGDQRAA